ncbi:hypothetical protein [Cupriavidus sp. RAF12]|uniref:hypothetical protein n=1 Tax=Cupriavidus sp. RAF12 TaxID=3233050 RepID=UPI003F8EBBCC
MMNAEDAMGLQEDLARIGRQPAPRQEPLPDPDESGNALAVAIVALRAQQRSAQERHRKQLDDVMSERNEVVVSAKAARDTIDVLARELARRSGLSGEECLGFAKETLSRRYDVLLDEAIENHQVLRDIRTIPEEIQKVRWYSPAR